MRGDQRGDLGTNRSAPVQRCIVEPWRAGILKPRWGVMVLPMTQYRADSPQRCHCGGDEPVDIKELPGRIVARFEAKAGGLLGMRPRHGPIQVSDVRSPLNGLREDALLAHALHCRRLAAYLLVARMR